MSDTPRESIAIPVDASGKKFPANWRKVVGTGHMGLALQEDFLRHMETVKREIGFEYFRGHGLLSDAVGIYRENLYSGRPLRELGRPMHNFTYVDRIFDRLLDIGVRPFIEFGFMPNDLASGTQTQFWWKGNVTPPKDYELWSGLIESLCRHWLKRYGKTEVEQWFFEVWNEPDIQQFWENADQEEYFKLYAATAKAVKLAGKGLRVGGPATCPAGQPWIPPFLKFCYEDKIPLDFVSHHAYSAREPEFGPELDYMALREPSDLVRQFREAREKIETSKYAGYPLHITEYNSSYSPLCPVHDTPFNAAYIAYTLSEGGQFADTFSYWTFCDEFAEADVPKAHFHGGFGLLGLRGIRKPTFHLFRFFAALGEDILLQMPTYLATRRDDGAVAAVFWNPCMTPEDGPKPLRVRLPAPSDPCLVEISVVDEENGNPYGLWKAMGRPRFPSRAQVARLEEAAHPLRRFSQMRREGGFVEIDLDLGRNAVALVEAMPVEDESGDYQGLDESKVPGTP